jgi:hypothetical protein
MARWGEMVDRTTFTDTEKALVARYFGFFYTPGADIIRSCVMSSTSHFAGLRGGSSEPVPADWEDLVADEVKVQPAPQELPVSDPDAESGEEVFRDMVASFKLQIPEAK